jgi:phosphoribosyl 1,2-cyclic phosphodiesterase
MREFQHLEAGSLVRFYDDRPWLGPGGMRIEPIPASHDDEATHGFRIEVRERRGAAALSIGYLADTGTWSEAHVEALADVDVLAVEFNHDEGLQRASGRPAYLIARILGDRGHLSNSQGAGLVRRVLAASRRRSVAALVLLHLSEQCNQPALALAAARKALADARRRVPTMIAHQYRVTPTIHLAARSRNGHASAAGGELRSRRQSSSGPKQTTVMSSNCG